MKKIINNRNELLIPDRINTVATPDTLSGQTRFKNSRLGVEVLLQHLEGGGNLDEFIEWFDPSKKYLNEVQAILKRVRFNRSVSRHV